MKSIKNYHDDTISYTTNKDKTLLHQSVKLLETIRGVSLIKKNTSFSVANIQLQRHLSQFIKIFSQSSSQFHVESAKRNLAPASINSTEINKDIITQIAKLQEGLSSCCSRHRDTQLSCSVGNLSKSLQTYLKLLSKNISNNNVNTPHNPANDDSPTM